MDCRLSSKVGDSPKKKGKKISPKQMKKQPRREAKAGTLMQAKWTLEYQRGKERK